MIWFISAFSIGLLGSFHCIGMCGPIAISLPVHQLPVVKKLTAIVLYNLGRAITYSLFGLVFGLLGQGFYMAGAQQVLSVVLGLMLLLSVLLPSVWNKLFKSGGFISVTGIKSKLRQLFIYKSLPAMFLIGVLNGLLPCGLVYIGIAGAISTSNYFSGAAFMFFFGLGTFPVMATVAVFGQFIAVRYRNTVRRSVPIVIAIMAVLLVLRGLNLNIPILSPVVVDENAINRDGESNSKSNQVKKAIKCCPKPNQDQSSIPE